MSEETKNQGTANVQAKQGPEQEIFMKIDSVSLKKRNEITESMLQEYIWNHPEVLGFGELQKIDRERSLPGGGRLDLLFQAVDTNSDTPHRYECELQLGTTDESHIIRTIEYWDLERKRYPQCDHTAVLVAEDVTSRFLNVLHLLNGCIPLILLKMTVYEINGKLALTFTKVLDEVQLGAPDEEGISEPTNRTYWEKKTCKNTLVLTDKLFQFVKEIDPKVELNYTKYYIGLTHNKKPSNFCSFTPRKDKVIMIFYPLPDKEEISSLENIGLAVDPKPKYNQLFIHFSSLPTSKEQIDALKGVITKSRTAYGL